MATRTDPAHVLHVTTRTNGQYLTITVRALQWADDDSPRNIPTHYAYDPDPLAGIVATAQSDRSADNRDAYGWQFGLTADSGDLISPAVARASLRTLDRVGRVLESLDRDYGRAASFGAYIARIATALGVRVIMRPPSESATAHYTDGSWRVYSPGDAVAVIDGLTVAHRKAGAA